MHYGDIYRQTNVDRKKKIRCDDAWGESLTVEYLLIKRIKHFQSNFVRYKR